LVGLAAELLDARDPVIDVVDVEVGARAALCGLHVRDRGALLVADPGHVVLGRPGIGLELPAEERAPELALLLGVVCRNLDVNDLAGHVAPPLGSVLSILRPPGGAKIIDRASSSPKRSPSHRPQPRSRQSADGCRCPPPARDSRASSL